jgi:hypothetical protein
MKRLAFVAAVLASPAMAQTAAAPTAQCVGPEFRTLDFWVGEWIAEWTNADGTKGTGTNRITRDEYGQCVITERFRVDDGSFNGFSISTYRPGLKQWRQNWVDDQGGYFDLVGGPVTGADHAFVFENKRIAEPQPYQRMLFQDVKPDSFTWRWQRRAKADETWSDSWVIRYRRKPGSAVAAKEQQ